MNKITSPFAKTLVFIIFCGCCGMTSNCIAIDSSETKHPVLDQKKVQSGNSKKENKAEVPVGLQRLLKAYPDHLKSATQNTLVWKDNTTMTYDDGIPKKEYDNLLASPDLEDQLMAYPYSAGRNYVNPPTTNLDPGRIRYEPFFHKMYGRSAKEVKSHLVPIKWLRKSANKTLMITSVNNVNKKLQAVSDELDMLPADLKKYVTKPAGTFNWRPIKNTGKISPHSFGIAIDISTKYSDYWEWGKSKSTNQTLVYKNQIPLEIVEIFEKHGFIWGGKWYHYDTMHFEYRPEMLIK